MSKRIAFYGGTFDPVHRGHTDVAEGVIRLFQLDEFVFVPAFHAPHKLRSEPTSAFHRFAMLCLASYLVSKSRVSTIELELPEKPFTIETLERLHALYPSDRIFFVIGADSWEEITTWREWEKVLTSVDIVVVTRPGHEISEAHVGPEIAKRIVDLRSKGSTPSILEDSSIFITDAAFTDISATRIRRQIREGSKEWRESVDPKVVEHIEKYGLYLGDDAG